MFIKRAGTILLAVSIVLWAMMSFPPLPEEKAKPFEEKEASLTAAFLADPVVAQVFRSESDLEAFEKFRKGFAEKKSRELKRQNPAFFELASTLRKREKAVGNTESAPASVRQLAGAYTEYSQEKKALEGEKQSLGLRNTIGGRVGVALESLFGPMGFDWRTNVALLGGFAAKEVIVATLGTAYSLGEVEPEKAESLSDKLSKDPHWNPLMAFTLLLFVMLYNPCVATLVTIKKETGKWRWTLFAMAYTTILAYCVALAVHSAGTLLKLGT